ncbi:Aste57867_7102 [Aphanomyces stellatus]|nr:hypothetical protein As57867_007079 [Aphanomyces stellatus]VFT84037.1 Aste57867_7102 [Aphanomyces stellatus]
MESNEPGVLDYYKLYFGSPRGAVLGKHFNSLYLKGAMRTSARAILNLDEHFTTERLRPLLSLPLRDDLSNAKRCHGCSTSFNWRTAKKLCRACGVAICPKCSSLWSLTLQGSAIKVPLCAPCVGTNLDANIEHSKITYDNAEASCVSSTADETDCFNTTGAHVAKSPDSVCALTFRSTASSSSVSHESTMSMRSLKSGRSPSDSQEADAIHHMMTSIDQQKDLLLKLQQGLASRSS